MLRFCCEKCGCKISVHDENAGMKAKCPKCKNLLIVPKKSNTIDFICQSCGQKISVFRKNSGQKGRCPNCKNPVIVPGHEEPVYSAKKEKPEEIHFRLMGDKVGLALADMKEELKLQNPPNYQAEIRDNVSEQSSEDEIKDEETELAERRSLPWFIDIFFFPINSPGLTNLAIFTVIPMISRLFGLPGLIVRGLMGLYFGWYFTECVRDSAKGNTRAPEAFASMGIGEMWGQMQHIIGCYLILILPAFFYSLYTQKQDSIYWGLLLTGSFFFPMGLLACIMFDSIGGLNPILLLGSIFSTFFQYIFLVVLVVGIVFAFISLAKMLESTNTQKLSVSILALESSFLLIGNYFALVISNLIGRFYWKNEEKLNWEC